MKLDEAMARAMHGEDHPDADLKLAAVVLACRVTRLRQLALSVCNCLDACRVESTAEPMAAKLELETAARRLREAAEAAKEES